MHGSALEGGFSQPAHTAALAFRTAMDVMARPGHIAPICGARPPAPLSGAAGTLILTLCDSDTPIHLAGGYDTQSVRDWITFHTGAPFAPAQSCTFAVGTWADLTPLGAFPVGTAQYPDRSATLIVECAKLTDDGPRLTGPGIRDHAALSLPETTAFQHNAARFPLGLDFFFTSGDRVAALPRSTQVE